MLKLWDSLKEKLIKYKYCYTRTEYIYVYTNMLFSECKALKVCDD